MPSAKYSHQLLVSGIVTLLLSVTLTEPFGSDNAVLHSMALDWIRLGRVPYIGSWDNNFPGIIYVHALSILLFGAADIGYRVLDVLIEAGFALFLFQFLRRWFKQDAAALAAILYVAVYVSGAVDVYGKQDTYGMMVQLMGIALFLPKRPEELTKWRNVALGGCVAGVSLLMRPTFLLFIAISTVAILWIERRNIIISCSKSMLFVCSAMLPALIVLAFYGTQPNGILAIYHALIAFNRDLYVSLPTPSKLWWEIARSGLMIPLAIYAILPSSRMHRFLKREPSVLEKVMYAVFIAGIFGVVLLMGKHYRYHLAPFFMLLVPLTAAGMMRVLERLHQRGLRVATVIMIVLCSFITYNPIAPYSFGKALLQGEDPFASADRARRKDSMFGAIPEQNARLYIERNNPRRESVEVCGFAPFLRYHLPYEPAGNYITFHALAFRTDGITNGQPHYTDYQTRWQQNYIKSLEQKQPKFIVLSRQMSFWYIRDVYDDCLHYLPGFDSLLVSSYRYDTTFGGYQLYRRIDTP